MFFATLQLYISLSIEIWFTPNVTHIITIDLVEETHTLGRSIPSATLPLSGEADEAASEHLE